MGLAPVEVEPGLQVLHQEGPVLLNMLAQDFRDGDGHHLQQDGNSHIILYLNIEVLLQA